MYAYERHGDGEKLLVVANFTAGVLARSYQVLEGADAQVVLSNYADAAEQSDGAELTLRPYEARIYRIAA